MCWLFGLQLLVDEPAQPAAPAAVAGTKAPQVPTDGDPLFAQLAAWVQQLTEEAIC
ncbi:MAG TPA: hypothetical protein VKE41_02450 [Roseiflexaceae bacterium]|nr:hypothetical protein [Roseiflexaceae bacterium]